MELSKFYISALGTGFEAFRSLAETSLTFLGIGQSAFYHGHDLEWAEIDYYLQVRQVHFDMVNNIREDVRDLTDMHDRKMENAMLVATLMLSLGFGFVVEGTFPPQEPQQGNFDQPADYRSALEAYHWQVGLRYVYAFLAGLSFVAPFLSLLFLLECKHRLNMCVAHYSKLLSKAVEDMYRSFRKESENVKVLHRSTLIRNTVGLPWETMPTPYQLAVGFTRDWDCSFCRKRRRQAAIGDTTDTREAYGRARRFHSCPRRPRPKALSCSYVPPREHHVDVEVSDVLTLRSDFEDWWEKNCDPVMRSARLFLYIGTWAIAVCCAILLGMTFRTQYPDTPYMALVYAFVIVVCAVGGAVLVVWYHLRPDSNKKHPSWLHWPHGQNHTNRSFTDWLFRRRRVCRSSSSSSSRVDVDQRWLIAEGSDYSNLSGDVPLPPPPTPPPEYLKGVARPALLNISTCGQGRQ